MKALTLTRRVGGSLTVTIPVEIVREKALREGEVVEVDVERAKKSYFGAAKGIGPFTKEDELDTHE